MQILWFTELKADNINSYLTQIILTEKPRKMADVPYNRSTFPPTLGQRDTLKPADLVYTLKKFASLLEESQKAAKWILQILA